MTTNLLDHRSIKFLRQFSRDVDELLELLEDSDMTKDDLDKKAVAISTAIEHEKSRV